MEIDLAPENKQIEEERYCYSEWDKIYDFIKEHCHQLFTKEELDRAYWPLTLEVPEWKATEMSLLLISLELLTERGDTILDQFHAFCRDSKGFTIK